MRNQIVEIDQLANEIAIDSKHGNVGWRLMVRLFFMNDDGIFVESESKYLFDEEFSDENEEVRERLATDLFDTSMKWRIAKAFRMRQDPLSNVDPQRHKDGYYVLGYKLYLERSTNGQTNISPEIVESLCSFFKNGDGR